MLVGAIAYTYNDIFFSRQGYVWVFLWYTLCVVDSVIMKHVADTVPMTTWSRTYYNVRPETTLRVQNGFRSRLLCATAKRSGR